jgi:hypothetical protein
VYRGFINTITHEVHEKRHISLPVGSPIVQIVSTQKPADILRKAAGNDNIYNPDKIMLV